MSESRGTGGGCFTEAIGFLLVWYWLFHQSEVGAFVDALLTWRPS